MQYGAGVPGKAESYGQFVVYQPKPLLDEGEIDLDSMQKAKNESSMGNYLCLVEKYKLACTIFYFKNLFSIKSAIAFGSLISKQGISMSSCTSEATAIRLFSLALINSRLSSARNTSIFG